MCSSGTFATQRQLARRCSRHRPRSIRARGSAVVSCRAPTRRRRDPGSHRQSLGIDQGMNFAAFHLLAGVVTHLVVFTAPFSADFTDWLSRTAAEGLASRPIRSRSAICSSLFFSQIRQSPAIGPHARSRQLRAEKEGSLRNRPRLETLSPLSGNRKFESISLQQTVRLTSAAAFEGREPGFPRGFARMAWRPRRQRRRDVLISL